MTVDEYNDALDAFMSEEEHQIRLFTEFEVNAHKYPELLQVFHVANGGYRHKATAGKLKALGVRAGVPDLLLLVPRGKYHGMALELKRIGKGAVIRPTQAVWLDRLQRNGYCAVVASGWRDALRKIIGYLEL